MQPYNQYQHYDQSDTPMGLDNVPDQMKPIAYKHSRNENLDILLNKFFNNGELTDIQLQQLNQYQKVILQEVKKKTQTKTKRPDQYQKLFFKKAFKYAQNAFFKKNKKNRSRRMSQFYHHHFDPVIKAMNIPLTNFYHPDKKTKPGLTTGQKSFNSSYIKMILKSLSFRKICIEYHAKFKQDCRQERNKKISTFTNSLFSVMQKSKQDRTKLIRFLQSSKCKIPWCDRDVEEAYKRAGEELDDYGVQVEEKGDVVAVDVSADNAEKEVKVIKTQKRLQKKKANTLLPPIITPSNKDNNQQNSHNQQEQHHNTNSINKIESYLDLQYQQLLFHPYTTPFHHQNNDNYLIKDHQQQIQLLHYQEDQQQGQQQQKDVNNVLTKNNNNTLNCHIPLLSSVTMNTKQHYYQSSMMILDDALYCCNNESEVQSSQTGSVLRLTLDQMRI